MPYKIKWTEDSLRAEATKYSTKTEFCKKNGGAYKAARVRFPGLLDKLFVNRKAGRTYWTRERLATEAAKYSTKAEFARGSFSAYMATIVRFPKWMDELFENQPRYTDANVLYVWRVKGVMFNEQPVFKIGVTSRRLGKQRIYECARKNKIEVENIQLFDTLRAGDLERQVHQLLSTVPDCGFTDGRSEFRSCSEEDMRVVCDLLNHTVSKS